MNKYHYSPKLEEWSRCVAPTPDRCPFKDDPHGDRTEIANEYGGAVATDGAARELLITPVVGGVYAVFPESGDARTYTGKGDLIEARNRAAYLNKIVLPKLQASASDPNASDQDRALAGLISTRTVAEGDRTYTQFVLPRIEFKDETGEPVVVRRAAPGAMGESATAPSTQASATEKQAAKASKKARRQRIMRQCRSAVRMGKAYKGQLNKAVGKSSGDGASKSSGTPEGLFSWFLELFDFS